MGINSLVIILLAMAVGGVVGFEVGQHLARKQMMAMFRQIADDLQKQAEAQKAEKEKRLEEMQESAQKLKEQWRKAWKKLLNPDSMGTVEPCGDTDGDEVVSVRKHNQEIEKEQEENGIQH